MFPECLMNVCQRKSSTENYKWKKGGQEQYKDTPQSLPKRLQHTNRVLGTDCTGLWEGVLVNMKQKESANVLSGKPGLRHHQQSFLPQTSHVLSATGNLDLRLVSSAILEHTNSNTSCIWLGLVIVSNDRGTITSNFVMGDNLHELTM